MSRLRILTWHVHGNYLYYLSRIGHQIFLPVRNDGRPGYGGRGTSFPFPPNVVEIPADEVRHQDFDCVLYQSRQNYLEDRFDILSDEQLRLPSIYLEHDTPQEHPTNTVHIVDDPNTLLVHVTHFNALMWDCGRTPATVIEHGVEVPSYARYTGQVPAGIVVVNNLARRGRRLGADVYLRLREELPLDLVGMGSEDLGGLGEVLPMELPEFERHYRFFLHPVRWTSLGLAVLEAMQIGMPVVGLATTELPAIIENGRTGFIATDPGQLREAGEFLLDEPGEARRIGAAAREMALDRFGIQRFARDWERVLAQVCGERAHVERFIVRLGATA